MAKNLTEGHRGAPDWPTMSGPNGDYLRPGPVGITSRALLGRGPRRIANRLLNQPDAWAFVWAIDPPLETGRRSDRRQEWEHRESLGGTTDACTFTGIRRTASGASDTGNVLAKPRTTCSQQPRIGSGFRYSYMTSGT